MIRGNCSNKHNMSATIVFHRFNDEDEVEQPQSADIPKSNAHSIVRLLAFTQSLLFIAFCLFLCGQVGAEPSTPKSQSHKLAVSTYEPTKTRDPFAQIGVRTTTQKSLPTTSLSFQLQGILFDPISPSAIVNDRLVNLGEKITLQSRNSEVEVIAVSITPNRVLLEVQGQRIELTINEEQRQVKEKDNR